VDRERGGEEGDEAQEIRKIAGSGRGGVHRDSLTGERIRAGTSHSRSAKMVRRIAA